MHFLAGTKSLVGFFMAVTTVLTLETAFLGRDYTNPYLPVAPSAIDGNGQVNSSLCSFLDVLCGRQSLKLSIV